MKSAAAEPGHLVAAHMFQAIFRRACHVHDYMNSQNVYKETTLVIVIQLLQNYMKLSEIKIPSLRLNY
jgi:hypothetical protein